MQSILAARAERYRLMAEEIRTAADALAYRESRRALAGIADNYELLAAQLEHLMAREGGKANPG
jgi:hypothetical protein